MINWFDMPAEGLSNGGQFEVKELEVTENGTYEEKGEMYNKVTVNVEGGGGSSDFSTANVTFICNTSEVTTVEIANVQEAKPPFEPNSKTEGYVVLENGHEVTIKAVLYKGMCDCFAHNVNMSGSGNVVIDFDNATITGDCTITIS